MAKLGNSSDSVASDSSQRCYSPDEYMFANRAELESDANWDGIDSFAARAWVDWLKYEKKMIAIEWKYPEL